MWSRPFSPQRRSCTLAKSELIIATKLPLFLSPKLYLIPPPASRGQKICSWSSHSLELSHHKVACVHTILWPGSREGELLLSSCIFEPPSERGPGYIRAHGGLRSFVRLYYMEEYKSGERLKSWESKRTNLPLLAKAKKWDSWPCKRALRICPPEQGHHFSRSWEEVQDPWWEAGGEGNRL